MEPLARAGACIVSFVLLWKGAGPLESGACAALVLYPWLLFAGMPRAARVGRPGRALASELAILLPLLALSLRIDAREAWTRDGLIRAAIGGTLFVLLSLGASVASTGSRARALHGWLWFVLVPCLPLAVAVSAWGSTGARAPWTALARASPLAWIHAQCLADASASSLPWGAFATCAVLLMLAWLARERESPA